MRSGGALGAKMGSRGTAVKHCLGRLHDEQQSAAEVRMGSEGAAAKCCRTAVG